MLNTNLTSVFASCLPWVVKRGKNYENKPKIENSFHEGNFSAHASKQIYGALQHEKELKLGKNARDGQKKDYGSPIRRAGKRNEIRFVSRKFRPNRVIVDFDIIARML